MQERRDANRAVTVSATGLTVTGLAELLVAILTGSVGLLGDAIHNLSDVSASAVVFVEFRLSRKPPTNRYPYGLERAEDLAGIGIAAVIWASATFAGYESIRKLLEHGPTTHVALGMAGAALGIAGNQVVARYKLLVGRRINSATLVADARRSWLDALSSLGALGGLVAVTWFSSYLVRWRRPMIWSSAVPSAPRSLVWLIWRERQRGPVAGHHCIVCQCALIFLVSASGVSPVSTSPALLIADQRPPSALKPW